MRGHERLRERDSQALGEHGAELAIAVNGRVEATTRVYRADDRPVYAALVPPSALRDGANSVVALEVRADGELRPLG